MIISIDVFEGHQNKKLQQMAGTMTHMYAGCYLQNKEMASQGIHSQIDQKLNLQRQLEW